MQDFLNGRDKVGIEAAKKSGRILINNFGKIDKIDRKKDGTLVTNVDLRMEKEIVEVIKTKFPKDQILSEENNYPVRDRLLEVTDRHQRCLISNGASPVKNSRFCWIIDPLDGTHNYIREINIVGTSIALAFNKEIIMGIIHMPFAKELYFARKGGGSYLNGRKISVSNRTLKESTLIYDSNIIHEQTENMLNHLKGLKDKVFIMRMFGSTARSLSHIAEGKADLEIEYTDKVWDFAAGAVLVEEAGGRFTTHDGKRYNLETKDYIASNGVIHDQVLKIIKNV